LAAVKYKERYPWITLRKAKELLAGRGINISLHGLWNIWKRYGYTGLDLSKLSSNLTEGLTATKEIELELRRAFGLFNKGRIREAANLLNSLPYLIESDLLFKIPDELLNWHRRLEKMTMQFGKIPLLDYLNQTKEHYYKCIKHKFYYSALRIGIALLIALSWKGDFNEMLKWLKKISKLIPGSGRKNKGLLPIYLSLEIMRCFIFANLLELEKSFSIAYKCYRKISHYKNPLYNFLYDLAAIYINLEDYPRAEKILKKILSKIDPDRQKKAKIMLAYNHLLRGEKEKAKSLLAEGETYGWVQDAQLSRYQALYALIEGEPSKAIDLAKKSISEAKYKGLLGEIGNAYIIMASAYMSAGQKETAIELLKRAEKLTKKAKLYRQKVIIEILLRKNLLNKELLKLSTIKLAWLLKNKGFLSAYRYAQRKGIILYFYRYLFFFPEIVIKRIKQRKVTYLPKKILKLPIFNTESKSYHIKLLGRVIIYHQQKYLNVELTPKEQAILCYIATTICEPERSTNLSALLSNFWAKSAKPSYIFSHTLVRIKKALKMPSHLLTISRSNGENHLINNGIYFTTDYQEFQHTLARAKALQRAGEWEFAKKEFLQAFKLFRGEPFKKNFDDWSVNMRFRILTELETEAVNFAKGCLEHNDKRDARKILEKVLKIIPDSEEIKKMMQDTR
jgi:Tfp pilus assembly protein PilF